MNDLIRGIRNAVLPSVVMWAFIILGFRIVL